MTSDAHRDLLRAFGERVRRNIARELEREDALSKELKARIVPLVRGAVAEARGRGECGRAWLFGSFAWGDPQPGSDVDVMVGDCADPDALAVVIMRATDRMVHVVPIESAPESLKARVLGEGSSL